MEYINKSRKIYTDLLGDLPPKQQNDMTNYGLLMTNIALLAHDKNDKDAQKNVETALEYFGVNQQYTVGGKVFVFDDLMHVIYKEQEFALKIYPGKFKDKKLKDELTKTFKINYSKFSAMSSNQYLIHFIKTHFSDILNKGIKYEVACIAALNNNESPEKYKKANYKNVVNKAYKYEERYVELPVEPSSEKYKKIIIASKKDIKVKTFYEDLYKLNIKLKPYFTDFLDFCIESVKYLDYLNTHIKLQYSLDIDVQVDSCV